MFCYFSVAITYIELVHLSVYVLFVLNCRYNFVKNVHDFQHFCKFVTDINILVEVFLYSQ